jgi:hypothetical protein
MGGGGNGFSKVTPGVKQIAKEVATHLLEKYLKYNSLRRIQVRSKR